MFFYKNKIKCQTIKNVKNKNIKIKVSLEKEQRVSDYFCIKVTFVHKNEKKNICYIKVFFLFSPCVAGGAGEVPQVSKCFFIKVFFGFLPLYVSVYVSLYVSTCVYMCPYMCLI